MDIQTIVSELIGILELNVTRYEGNEPQESIPLPSNKETSGFGALWRSELKQNLLETDGIQLDWTTLVKNGHATSCALSLAFDLTSWSKENYVLMPGAVYNGNRFEMRSLAYPPLLEDADDIGPNKPILTTLVPGLSQTGNSSIIEMTTLDPATPAIGFYDPKLGKGFWLLTEQLTSMGATGITLQEFCDANQASIKLTVPRMRKAIVQTAYPAMYLTSIPDRAPDWPAGNEVSLTVRIHIFDCCKLQDLFDRFMDLRQSLIPPKKMKHELPFSAAWSIQESEYNKEKWVETYGYYAVGMQENSYQDWQVGWVGGAMATLPLLFEGSEVSKARALKTLDFLFSTQAESGFFHGIFHKGVFSGDGFMKPHAEKWHLIRKSADALYFVMKQILLIERMGHPEWIRDSWVIGIQRLADAFVRLWDEYGQFGQFVLIDTGEIVVGGSTCAAIAPAGLALAGKWLNDPHYLSIAEQAAEKFYAKDTCEAISTGGPGEILQCPDSESAFGLLESFVVLYEVTRSKLWLIRAQEMAHQCATWCVSYDYIWPEEAEFGRLDIRTAGSVIANVQNKHSAPGICTLSGDSLFKLFRATGELKYLQLIRETAHNMTQYLSREEREISDWDGGVLHSGWMNERVNLSDWEGTDKIGGVFHGPCWPEVSNMLTYIEIPGLYIQPDTRFICAIDHIEAELLQITSANEIRVRITNPTNYAAKVKVWLETSTQAKEQVLGANALYGCSIIELAPLEIRVVSFKS